MATIKMSSRRILAESEPVLAKLREQLRHIEVDREFEQAMREAEERERLATPGIKGFFVRLFGTPLHGSVFDDPEGWLKEIHEQETIRRLRSKISQIEGIRALAREADDVQLTASELALVQGESRAAAVAEG